MVIHPVDLQVALTKSSEVNKVQRVNQDQQQINQQLNDESVRLSLSIQSQTIQKSKETEQEELKNDDRSKKRKKKEEEKEKKEKKDESSGGLDIKI